MEEKRVEAFDRWNWETGAKEDREEFERLEKKVEEYPSVDDEMIHKAKGIMFKGMLEDIEMGMYHDQNPETLKEVLKKLEEKRTGDWIDKTTD